MELSEPLLHTSDPMALAVERALSDGAELHALATHATTPNAIPRFLLMDGSSLQRVCEPHLARHSCESDCGAALAAQPTARRFVAASRRFVDNSPHGAQAILDACPQAVTASIR